MIYDCVNLKDILEDKKLGENEAKHLLAQFSCPQNLDVELFLKNSAIEFTKQGLSSTFLILAPNDAAPLLLGYFTLANKAFCFTPDSIISKTWKRRLLKFGQFEDNIQQYLISAPLIGQLGKNFANSYNTLITGKELLNIAFTKIREVQYILGGKLVFIESENKTNLLEFYSSNDFFDFGIRNSSKKPLVQMLKYLR